MNASESRGLRVMAFTLGICLNLLKYKAIFLVGKSPISNSYK
ncbi:protein of unknown function [Xenorhabdus doucetiae]|uniref:Uncharacterized protein n=1 Tax=Xenorhabdus doucetiae TaxID=351671 RepID=A0A068QRE7_9GAMM|nr:protein of unknown function [Xenorhabdus doucetiae]